MNPNETAVVDQFDVVLPQLRSAVFSQHAELGSEEIGLPGFSGRPEVSSDLPDRSLDEWFEALLIFPAIDGYAEYQQAMRHDTRHRLFCQ